MRMGIGSKDTWASIPFMPLTEGQQASDLTPLSQLWVIISHRAPVQILQGKSAADSKEPAA